MRENLGNERKSGKCRSLENLEMRKNVGNEEKSEIKENEKKFGK